MKKGLCEKVCLELYELQPQQSGGGAFVVAGVWSGLLKVSKVLTFGPGCPLKHLLTFYGRLSPARPPDGALTAAIELGTLPKPRDRKQGKRRDTRVLRTHESEFCCNLCELAGWALEELNLRVDVRKRR